MSHDNKMIVADPTPEEQVRLDELYAGFKRHNMVPLWTEIGELMPDNPSTSS